jgi:hypothetical protein
MATNYCEVPSSTDFSISVESGNRAAGFKSTEKFQAFLEQYFDEGSEYIVVDGKSLISEETLHMILMVADPSERDCSEEAPEHVLVPAEKLYKKQIRIRKS